jgi:hypothetical protein
MNCTCTAMHRGRWGRAVAGLGMAAGAFGAATLIGVATASTAHADSPFDLGGDVQNALALGEADITAGVSDFAHGDMSEAVFQVTAGLDNVVLSPVEDLLVGSVDPSISATDFEFFPAVAGTDAAQLTADAQQLMAAAPEFLTTAAADLSSGDVSGGVFDGVVGLDAMILSAEDLIDASLLGSILAF